MFDVDGRKLANIADGTNDTDIINKRQLNEVKRYIREELYKAVKILYLHVHQVKLESYKLHGSRFSKRRR